MSLSDESTRVSGLRRANADEPVATQKRENRENMNGKINNGWKTILNTLTVLRRPDHNEHDQLKPMTATVTYTNNLKVLT